MKKICWKIILNRGIQKVQFIYIIFDVNIEHFLNQPLSSITAMFAFKNESNDSKVNFPFFLVDYNWNSGECRSD